MKSLRLLPMALLLFSSQVSAQNVGIGTSTPLANLHLAGVNPEFRINDDGSIIILNNNSTSFSMLRNLGNYTVLQNTHASGTFLIRPGNLGTNDVLITGTGIAIGPRGPLGSVVPNVALDIRADGEAVRIAGTTPYLTMTDQGNLRGYIQAWSDGLALASNGFDVGLWTNGVKRLAVKPNGALEVAGSTGSAGQVLTSNGAGAAPVWASPANGLYNSFRFITMSGSLFTSNNDGVWRDIPGMTHSFNLAGNHYVDVAAVMTGYPESCFNCDQPRVLFRLLVNGNAFAGHVGRGAGGLYFSSFPVTTGFTLPAGNHTIKWQVFTNSGSNFVLRSSDVESGNTTYMRVWMVPQ